MGALLRNGSSIPTVPQQPLALAPAAAVRRRRADGAPPPPAAISPRMLKVGSHNSLLAALIKQPPSNGPLAAAGLGIRWQPIPDARLPTRVLMSPAATW